MGMSRNELPARMALVSKTRKLLGVACVQVDNVLNSLT